jgi:hypothetical protein
MIATIGPFFGEFLVERGYVTDDALCGALLEQLTARPTVNEMCSRLGLLTSADHLRVLAYQARHRVDCRTACRALGLWRAGFDALLDQALIGEGLPLTEILLRRQALTLDSLTKALDAYLALAVAAVDRVSVPTPGVPLPPELRRHLLERWGDAPGGPLTGAESPSRVPWLLTVLDTATFFGLRGTADIAKDTLQIAGTLAQTADSGAAAALSMRLTLLKHIADTVAETGSEEPIFNAANPPAELQTWRAQRARKAG